MSGCIGCGAPWYALKRVCSDCLPRLTEDQRSDYWRGWLSDFDVIRILGGERGPVIHDLKTWPEPYRAVTEYAAEPFGRLIPEPWRHAKKHEVRRADRDYRVGDILHLREWDQDSGEYTGREWWMDVTHITPPGSFGLPEDLCVMSITDSWPDRVRAIRREARP